MIIKIRFQFSVNKNDISKNMFGKKICIVI